MSQKLETPAPPPAIALVITIIVVVAFVGWIILGPKFLGITSFFASFLFFWYWAAVEAADMKQWAQSTIGALVGLGLAWQSHWLPSEFGTPGFIGSILLIIAAVYFQITNKIPLVINRCAMLFLTVLAAPAILEKLDTLEVAMAIGLGALYFGAIIKLVTALTAKKV